MSMGKWKIDGRDATEEEAIIAMAREMRAGGRFRMDAFSADGPWFIRAIIWIRVRYWILRLNLAAWWHRAP